MLWRDFSTVSRAEDKLKQMEKKSFLLHLHCVIVLLLKQVFIYIYLIEKFQSYFKKLDF